MNTVSETLSANEAAIAAGVSIADVNRVVDRNILPNELFSASGSRSFRKEACVFISFYFGNRRFSDFSSTNSGHPRWSEPHEDLG